jgi:hypothetical protein
VHKPEEVKQAPLKLQLLAGAILLALLALLFLALWL